MRHRSELRSALSSCDRRKQNGHVLAGAHQRNQSLPDGAIAPWEQFETPLATTAGLHGELKVENDDQVMMVYFVDAVAQQQVTRVARDAAALAQEWGIPALGARLQTQSSLVLVAVDA